MKDDLKRLLNEFLIETVRHRTESVVIQHTESSPKRHETVTRVPNLNDLIDWLNDRIEKNEEFYET